MNLEQIGFYSLSEQRVKTANKNSPLCRCEMVLTDRCQLKCKYCRGIIKDFCGDINLKLAKDIISLWARDDLENIRFSGGEPTLYPNLNELVKFSRENNIKRIAISTNGTASLDKYKRLIDNGCSDFSISIDGGCCSVGDTMAGVSGAWEKAVRTIEELSKLTYITVGIVFTEININNALDTIRFVDGLHPADIRIIPSAQYNKAIKKLIDLPETILNKYPILKYRIGNMIVGKNIRGISNSDSKRCAIVLDDVAIVSNYHFPCIIYLREQGNPIGKISSNIREDRYNWFLKHDSYKDVICRSNCLDCIVEYNNKWKKNNEGI